MPAWRSPDLEALLGGPLDSTGITEEAIARLASEGTAESEQIDFKRDLYAPTKGPRPTWSDEQEFSKDVAAFANHRGGLILIGVEDVHGIASSPSPLPATAAPEVEERRLRQALLNYQAPLATCTFVWVKESAGGWFLAILVPPSPRSPHAVLGHRGDPRQTLHYPQRHGADTTWLSEAEVAERYRRRAALQYDEERRVEQVITEGCSALRQATGLWLYSAAVPELPVTARLDQAAVRVIEEWHRGSSSLSPLGRALRAYGRGIPAPGRVTFTGSLGSSNQDETTIQDAYLELHLDG